MEIAGFKPHIFASIETRLLTTNLGEDGLGKGSVPTVRVFQAVPVQD